ncbi:MAG: type IX secretion system protein PorQ [Bacteroidales bacterium]
MKRRPVFTLLFALILSLNGINLKAQIGGDNTYEFLNLSNSARVASLGGNFLAVYDGDITLAVNNPSLISPQMHNHLGLSFVNYFSGINYGFANYSRTYERLGSFAATMQFINYGRFTKADAAGTRQGEFNASELALNIGWGRKLHPHFTIGSDIKLIYSGFDAYNSFGLAVDVAGSYIHQEEDFTVSLLARNIGIQLKPYEGGNNEPLPFEMQLGLSKGLKHLPFRFSVLLNHLERWDLRYTDPLKEKESIDPLTGEKNEKSWLEKAADEAMRHIVVGGELNITDFLSFRIGYNYQRRQELKVDNKASTVGISWGVGLRISKFHFSYSRSRYHLAGSPNFITLTTNLSDFVKAD